MLTGSSLTGTAVYVNIAAGVKERSMVEPGPPPFPGRTRVFSRRRALGLAAALAAVRPAASHGQATPTTPDAAGGTRVVLIGTGGGPIPTAGPRVGICSALVVNGNTYLVDLGQDCLTNILKAGLAFSSIQGVFVTHLHSDHMAELYNLFWLNLDPVYGIGHPVDVWGPGRAGGLPAAATPVPTIDPARPTPGLTDFFASSIAATAYDANIRIRDEGWLDIREVVRPHDIALPDVGASATGDIAPAMDPFPVMENDDIAVSAILVRHTPVFPSFAFRFDTAAGSVVFSGDTTVTDNLVTLARGADLLLHEAIDLDWAKALDSSPEQLTHLSESHTDVDLVGAIAEACGVPTLVLTHIVPDSDQVSDDTWRAKAQQGFSGEVIVGRDLMTIPLGGG